MTEAKLAAMIAVMSAVTILLRFLPFILFGTGRKTPPVVEYLGRVLPYAIMGMLVVYCLKGVDLVRAPHGIPEGIACLAVVVLQVVKRSTLLSIIAGTVVYMVLVQAVF